MRSWKHCWPFVLTNWTNCVSLIGATYVACIGWAVLENGSKFSFWDDAFLGPLFLIAGYGIVVWPWFLTAMLAMDTLIYLIVASNSDYSKTRKLDGGLLLECGVIGSPFIYWAITQDYPLWYLLVTVFVLSQLLWRRKLLQKLIVQNI